MIFHLGKRESVLNDLVQTGYHKTNGGKNTTKNAKKTWPGASSSWIAQHTRIQPIACQDHNQSVASFYSCVKLPGCYLWPLLYRRQAKMFWTFGRLQRSVNTLHTIMKNQRHAVGQLLHSEEPCIYTHISVPIMRTTSGSSVRIHEASPRRTCCPAANANIRTCHPRHQSGATTMLRMPFSPRIPASRRGRNVALHLPVAASQVMTTPSHPAVKTVRPSHEKWTARTTSE